MEHVFDLQALAEAELNRGPQEALSKRLFTDLLLFESNYSLASWREAVRSASREGRVERSLHCLQITRQYQQ